MSVLLLGLLAIIVVAAALVGVFLWFAFRNGEK
jgi:hypothetical protein